MGVEGRIPAGGHGAAQAGFQKCQLVGGSSVSGGTSVVDADLVATGGVDVEQPDYFVVRVLPVDEVGAVGGAAAALDLSAGCGIAGGKDSDRELTVTHWNGARVHWGAWGLGASRSGLDRQGHFLEPCLDVVS